MISTGHVANKLNQRYTHKNIPLFFYNQQSKIKKYLKKILLLSCCDALDVK